MHVQIDEAGQQHAPVRYGHHGGRVGYRIGGSGRVRVVNLCDQPSGVDFDNDGAMFQPISFRRLEQRSAHRSRAGHLTTVA